jgi:hydroxyethylthiazole kinase-like uncharacterized protein yjeF
MLKILTTAQIKSLDGYTVEHEPVPSIDLMERACVAFVSWFTIRFNSTKKIGIICGTGNNGGDGLGIARLLIEQGFLVNVWVVRGSVPESTDFRINFDRLKKVTKIGELTVEIGQRIFADRDVLMDAIFGSGLSRPPDGIYAQVIHALNETNAMRVAVDIPSGLMADKHSTGEVFQSHHTVTFQLPKLSFLFPQYASAVGEWHVLNIGLSNEFIHKAECNYFLLEESDVKALLRPRTKFNHKGNFGHALLIAGGHGKMGAAILSARAALRSGLGLLTVHVPRCGYEIIQSAVPEAMASVDDDENNFSAVPETKNFTAIGIGPGLGQTESSAKALQQLLKSSDRPMVIDADGLNLMGLNKGLVSLIPAGSILTPHPKEFERLVGKWANDFERLEKQIDFSRTNGAIVVLKGAHSSVSMPDGRVYFNNTGNPGMATGGSGDVLTGLVTGLLARGYTSEESALIGVWIHGLAGDLAQKKVGMEGLIASDIIDCLPEAFGHHNFSLSFKLFGGF